MSLMPRSPRPRCWPTPLPATIRSRAQRRSQAQPLQALMRMPERPTPTALPPRYRLTLLRLTLLRPTLLRSTLLRPTPAQRSRERTTSTTPSHSWMTPCRLFHRHTRWLRSPLTMSMRSKSLGSTMNRLTEPRFRSLGSLHGSQAALPGAPGRPQYHHPSVQSESKKYPPLPLFSR